MQARSHATKSARPDPDNKSPEKVQSLQLNDQVRTLQGQIEVYEQEIEHFELVKSDWQLEKEALEEVLLKMREQLREKEEALLTTQKVLYSQLLVCPP